MQKFLNTNVERFLGEQGFLERVCPVGYQRTRRGFSAFFAKYNFKVDLMYSDYYKSVNGMDSDLYLSQDLWYAFVLPSLNNYALTSAYTDKNFLYTLFPDVLQPECIVRCMNGIYYDKGWNVLTAVDAARMCVRTEELVIKPTMNTLNGDGVTLLQTDSAERALSIFKNYGRNFIVQEKIRQHAELARLNPSSVNTMRIYTLRTQKGIVRLDNSFVRFSSAGSVRDNVSSGGGACRIIDGVVDDKIVRLKSQNPGSLLAERGVEHLVIPNFEVAANLVRKLHERLPYFDVLGWDVAVREDDAPILIEYNTLSAADVPQLLAGPMFGEYTAEVMSRVSEVRKEKRLVLANVFPDGNEYAVKYG